MNVNRCWLNLDIRTCFGIEDVECVLEFWCDWDWRFWKGPWWIGNKPFVVVVVVAWSRDERIYSIPVFCLHPGIFSFAFWCVLCCVLLRRSKDVVSAVSCRCTVTCSEIWEKVFRVLLASGREFWFPGDLISVSVRHGLRFASFRRQGFHANIAIDYLPDSADGKEEPVCQSFQDGRSNSSETALQLISAHRVATV